MEAPPAKKLKMAKEPKPRNIVRSFTISSTLTCAVEDGQYGRFLRLSRGILRWIVLSVAQFENIVDNKQQMGTEDYCLKLSDEKQVKVILFKEKRYVSFHSTTSKTYDTYVNMNEEEWDMFKRLMPDITEAMQKCSLCKGEKVKRKLYDGSMLKTKLSPQQLADVEENNETAYNQLAYQCTYCGQSFDYEDTCHCHRYNCRECEPDNFCKQCGDVTVVSV